MQLYKIIAILAYTTAIINPFNLLDILNDYNYHYTG